MSFTSSTNANTNNINNSNSSTYADSIGIQGHQNNNTHTGDYHDSGNDVRKQEVYRHETDWLISSVAWSNESHDGSLRLALCSFIEEYSNRIQLVTLAQDCLEEEISVLTTIEHPYPPTKALFNPSQVSSQLGSGFNSSSTGQTLQTSQLLATTADYLRIWRVCNLSDDSPVDYQQRNNLNSNYYVGNKGNLITYQQQQQQQQNRVKLECVLSNNKITKYCAPLTSFDWNDIDPTMIVTSSVDTICTLWNVEYGKPVGDTSNSIHDTHTSGSKRNDFVGCSKQHHDSSNQQNPLAPATSHHSKNMTCNIKTQVIAHDQEVYDVSYSRVGSGKEVFISSGADGTVRMFDLRHLKRSTVLYGSPRDIVGQTNSIARVSCNKQNPNYVSAFAFSSNEVQIIDIRNPGRPATTLRASESECVNCMSWAPHSSYHISTGSSDRQALIWDLLSLPEPIHDPLLAYNSGGPLNAINWSPTHQEWIATAYKNCLELLRV